MPCYQDVRELQPFLWRRAVYGIALAGIVLAAGAFGQTPQPSKDAERFPPLVVPAGFRATLYAADPLVEYASAIALGPRPHTLFVTHDYMTGLGMEIVRRDEIRLLADTDADGKADESTLFAEGFNSIQGLAYHAGTVYAMHAPLLTSLRDTDGDGKADERRDLLSGLGLPPEQNPNRLHCANGVAVGHDGWLYLALGDNGVDVPRPEGDRLVLHEGGILRCRPDGRDLHVFSAGLRNIYDVALDAELNVFVRDNENDGGDYMIRVCHSFHGADHGYPYLYYERPDEAMTPLADLGRGSSAGGVCYRETAFPRELHGSLIFCEWGRAVVRYDRQPLGSGFAPTKEIDLAAGAATDPYGFKPTDLVVDRDGSLLVADWCDGQRPKRGRGRIYRIAYGETSTSAAQPRTDVEPTVDRAIAQLDSPSYYARFEAQEFLQRGAQAAIDALLAALHAGSLGPHARMHAVWAIAHVQGWQSSEELSRLARTDPDRGVRAQAVRALADLADPVLREHRLDAGPAEAELSVRFAALAKDQHPRVLREIVIALGRLRWNGAPQWLQAHVDQPDAALAHATMQTLRRSGNWPAVLQLLDLPDSHSLRPIALRAIANRVDATIVDGLIERLGREIDPARQRQYADPLTRVYKQPAPWTYWGYRPAPRPANSVVWERTEVIEQALDRVLHDTDRDVRLAALRRMLREKVPTRLPTLAAWLREERGKEHVAEILRELKEHPPRATLALWEDIVRQPDQDVDNRLAAVTFLLECTEPRKDGWLLELVDELEDGPVMAVLFRGIKEPPPNSEVLLRKLGSPSAPVRAVAIDVLARHQVPEAAARVAALLDDADPEVRRAAAAAAGKLRVPDCGRKLLELAGGPDAELRSMCFDSLRQLRDPRATSVAIANLEQPQAQRAAIDYLAEWEATEQAEAVAKVAAQSRSHEIVAAAVAALAGWESKQSNESPDRRRLQETIAQLQASSGVLLRWSLRGPLEPQAAAKIALEPSPAVDAAWQSVMAARGSAEGRVDLPALEKSDAKTVWLALSEVSIAEPTRVQFLASASGTLSVWLNGQAIREGDKPAPYQPDALRFEGQLTPGRNRLLLRLAPGKSAARFHVRFRRIGSSAEHERLAQHLLASAGNAERGREVFQNAEKSLCLKCHRLGEQGGRVGPDLAGIGSRFSRVHLIESILEPSRAIAPSFETHAVALVDGRIVNGVRIAEDDQTLTLGDDQGRTHALPKTEIDERQAQTKSTMPEGLEKRLNDRELLDLIAFLLAQKKSQ